MALIYFQKMLQVLTSHTSKLPKKVLKNTKNMTPNSCSVRPEKFHPYKCYKFSESCGSREIREIKISTSKFDLEARGIFCLHSGLKPDPDLTLPHKVFVVKVE